MANTTGIRLVIGLGNPGERYAQTRHNVGIWFIDQLCQRESAELKLQSKLHGSLAKLPTQPEPIIAFVPDTYMNESGKAVLAVAHYYKILPENILIVHDDLDIDLGVVRLKAGGGHGGHNGLRDIIRLLHSNNFYRLRIGIGHPGHKDRVTGHVLNKPSKHEEHTLLTAIDETMSCVDLLINGNFEQAFQLLHSA